MLTTVAAATAVLLGATAVPAHADPNALWQIVGGRCVPHQERDGDPAPCAQVDLAGGSAVLKDLVGRTQFLLIPTTRIGGIESPELLAPGTPDYFAAAWRARRFVDQRAGVTLPRDWVSLAINSEYGRTQDQLHIHLDCVAAGVRDALVTRRNALGPAWAPFPLAGHPYLARTVAGLTDPDPFSALADGVPGAREDMGEWTLAAVGMYLADGSPGFVLLADRADPATGNDGSAEELQDHDACPPPGRWAK